MSDKGTLRIALWQCEQHPGDVAGNIERLRSTAFRAATDGVEVLVCPEMFLTGYAIGAAAVRRHAEFSDGPSSRKIAEVAKEAGVAIVWGFPEMESGNLPGRVFNAAQLVDAEGRLHGTYQKTHLYGDVDRAQFSASDGACSVFDLLGWRIGLLICYDVEFPEAVRRLALLGADLVLVPTANMKGFEAVPDFLVPARAYENQLYVAYANCCGVEGHFVYGGRSLVAGPGALLLARAGLSETLVVADLQLSLARTSPKLCLSDRRPETYQPERDSGNRG